MDPFEQLRDYERLSQRWVDSERRSGDISRFRYNNIAAVVQDMDGDGHAYSVLRGDAVLFQGTNSDFWGGATFALVESYLVEVGALYAPPEHIVHELIADRAKLESAK